MWAQRFLKAIQQVNTNAEQIISISVYTNYSIKSH